MSSGVNFKARVTVPGSVLTLEDLDKLTHAGLEPDTWNGSKLLAEIRQADLLLLVDFDTRFHYTGERLGSVEFPRREFWMARRVSVTQLPSNLPAKIYQDPLKLEATEGDVAALGTEWLYLVQRYIINANRRFVNSGYALLAPVALGGWLDQQLVDITARFDDALTFLRNQ